MMSEMTKEKAMLGLFAFSHRLEEDEGERERGGGGGGNDRPAPTLHA